MKIRSFIKNKETYLPHYSLGSMMLPHSSLSSSPPLSLFCLTSSWHLIKWLVIYTFCIVECTNWSSHHEKIQSFKNNELYLPHNLFGSMVLPCLGLPSPPPPSWFDEDRSSSNSIDSSPLSNDAFNLPIAGIKVETPREDPSDCYIIKRLYLQLLGCLV